MNPQLILGFSAFCAMLLGVAGLDLAMISMHWLH
jgi:hypothetical protein